MLGVLFSTLLYVDFVPPVWLLKSVVASTQFLVIVVKISYINKNLNLIESIKKMDFWFKWVWDSIEIDQKGD